MIIEKAAMQDIEQLTQLRLAYLMEDRGKLDEKELECIKKELPDYFARNLNHNIFSYVVRIEQEIVACAWLLVVEKPMSPAFINGKTGTVLNVYTKPEHRCKGYAKKAMDMLLADAVNMSLSVVELKSTEAGYTLYQSIGFKDAASKYHQMEWRNEGRP